MRDHYTRSQAAFSLIEALVGVGVAALGAMLAAHLITHSTRAQQHIQTRTELTDLKNQLVTALDCKQTVGAIGTTCNGIIPLRRANGATINNTFGPFTVRATCQAGQGLLVQAAKLRPGAAITTENKADFYTDHLTGQSLSWTNGTLFAYTDSLCGKYFPAATPVPTGGCIPTNYACISSPQYLTQTGNIEMIPSIIHCGVDNANFAYIHSIGTATCPLGWRPTGSAANCQYTGNSIEAGTNEGGGYTLSSVFTPDGHGVSYDCCAIVLQSRLGAPIVDGYLPPSGQGIIVVACVPENL